MTRSLKTRLVSGSASLALLSCLAHPAGAQEAAPVLEMPVASRAAAENSSPETPPLPVIAPEADSLRGIRDIDFSLDGEASPPATPAAQEAPPAGSAPATGTDAQPRANARMDRSPARPATSQADAPVAGAAESPATPQSPPASAAPAATASAAQSPGQATTAAGVPLASDDNRGGMNLALALLLVLVALAGAAFVAIRLRRDRAARQDVPDSANVVPWDDAPAPTDDPRMRADTDQSSPAEAQELPPVVAAGVPPAEPAPSPREADPGLRTRIPLAGHAAPATTPIVRQQPLPIPKGSPTRYDKFGLPVRVERPKPSLPRPTLTRPGPDADAAGRPRGLVRYDVMGLPIFE